MCPQKDDKFAEPTYGFSLLNSFLCSEYFFCFLFFSFLFFSSLHREIVARLLAEIHESTGPDSPWASSISFRTIVAETSGSFLLRLFYRIGRTKLDHVAQNDAWKNVSSASRSLLHTFYRCEEIVNSKKKKDNERYRK